MMEIKIINLVLSACFFLLPFFPRKLPLGGVGPRMA
jgi:hypothetical protein